MRRARGQPLTVRRAASTGQHIAVAIVFGLLLVFALVAAPREVGGRYSYFIVRGTSMQPVLNAGDLVAAEPSETYSLGDVIAFRDPQLGTVVHRITAFDGLGFVTRGANRTSDDPFRPASSDVYGRVDLRLATVGRVLEDLRRPDALLLVVALALVIAAGPATARGRKRMRTSLRWMARVPVAGTALGTQLALAGASCIAVGAGAMP